MATKPLPSQETLRQLLDYDPETGKLFWKERPRSRFKDDKSHATWNGRFSGKEAFSSRTAAGYSKSDIEGMRFYAHRVIWKWMTGDEPGQEIDHIDGDRTNNRWCNLRSVNKPVNARNKRMSSRNTSGVCGVSKHRNKWIASIRDPHGRSVYLGVYETIEGAASARKAAESAYGYHENHGQ